MDLFGSAIKLQQENIKKSDLQSTAQATQNRILPLLDELPPERLAIVEQFMRFLHERTRQGQAMTTLSEKEENSPYRYPTVAIPATSFHGLIGVMPPVGGDALADT